MQSAFRRSVDYLERVDTPVWHYVATFFAVVMLRNFLETFSSSHEFDLFIFVHYTLFYVSVGLALVLLLHFVIGETVQKVFRVVASFFTILVLPPVLDLVLGAGHAQTMSYILPGSGLLQRFFTFFGPYQGSGITLGIRAEVLVAVAATALYIYIKKHSWLSSLAGAALVYAIIFCFVAMPAVLAAALGVVHIPLGPIDGHLMILVFVSILAAEFLVLALITRRKELVLIVRDIRPERLLHYWLMLLSGVLLGAHAQASFTGQPLHAAPLFTLLLTLAAVTCAWVFSVITNNMSDIDIDEISNPERPLVRGAISPHTYRAAAWVTLAGALACAAVTGFWPFFIVLLFIGNYFIYSMPPIRFKRVPYFSKLVILLNSGALIMLGFISTVADSRSGGTALDSIANLSSLNAFSDHIDSFYAFVYQALRPVEFPPILTLVLVTLMAIQFIDLKDYDGDKRAGIKTLPVLFGMKASKILIAASFFILYCAAGLMLGDVRLLGIAVAAGLLQMYVLVRKPYQEKYVFAVYLSSLAVLLLFSI